MTKTTNGSHPNENEPTLFAMIQNVYSDLSATEKKIADYIINSPEQIMYNTVTYVADELGIAQSSVTRFCQNIGLRGFQELKIRLAQQTKTTLASDVQDDLGKSSLQTELAQVTANSVLDAAVTIDLEALKQAEESILRARKIILFGIGESGPIAQLFQIKLMGLGFAAEAYTDVHLQSISAAHADEKVVAIGISQQGSTKDIVSSLRYARSNGARVICITAQGKSPITEVSDIMLVCLQRGITKVPGNFQSKASILYVIELLTLMLNLRLANETPGAKVPMIRSTESILDKLY